MKVLIVDDEKSIRDLLADILSLGNHQIQTAADGETGFAAVEREGFDVIFTDQGLPGMNGMEFSARVKKIRPEIEMVLITGWGSQIDETQLKDFGIGYLVSKPFSMKDISELIRNISKKKKK
jgi:DNA-binding NtrC family response regulator